MADKITVITEPYRCRMRYRWLPGNRADTRTIPYPTSADRNMPLKIQRHLPVSAQSVVKRVHSADRQTGGVQ